MISEEEQLCLDVARTQGMTKPYVAWLTELVFDDGDGGTMLIPTTYDGAMSLLVKYRLWVEYDYEGNSDTWYSGNNDTSAFTVQESGATPAIAICRAVLSLFKSQATQTE